MARSVGKIFADIWQDPDWVRLTAPAQRTFLLILTQAKVNLAGVIDLKLERWAGMADGTTADDLQADLDELVAHRFLLVDTVTEEVAIRTFVKNDVAEGTFNRNTAKGVWSAWKSVESAALRAAIVHEVPEDIWTEKLLPHAPDQAVRIRRSGPPSPPSPDHSPNHGSDHGTDHGPDCQIEPSLYPLPSPSTDTAATADRTADTPTEAPSEPGPQLAAAADPDVTIRQALALLVDRAIALNPPNRNPTGHRKAITEGVRTDHLDRAHDLLDRDPGLTAHELADLLEPPPPAAPPTPADAAVRASTVQMERNAARTRGDACPTCDGAYWLNPELQDDRTWGPALPCPACNDEARTA